MTFCKKLANINDVRRFFVLPLVSIPLDHSSALHAANNALYMMQFDVTAEFLNAWKISRVNLLYLTCHADTNLYMQVYLVTLVYI